MNNDSKNSNQYNELVLVPKRILENIQEDQQRIIELIGNIQQNKFPSGTIVNKYIPEEKAKEMLGKGTTWFWSMRRDGKLKYNKVGNKIFYTLEDIEKLFSHKNGDSNDEI